MRYGCAKKHNFCFGRNELSDLSRALLRSSRVKKSNGWPFRLDDWLINNFQILNANALTMGAPRKPVRETMSQIHISIPLRLIGEIEEILEDHESRSKFICDLVRAHLESIKRKD